MSAKDTTTYWKKRISKRQINGVDSAHYYARMSHEDRRAWINLDTGDKDTASAAAALKYTTLKREGWEAIKPSKITGETITVGEWIKKVEALKSLRNATRAIYIRKLRQLIGEIKNIGDQRKYSAKGSLVWINKVDAVKLSELTDERVNKWKARRLGAIDCEDEEAAASANNTINSILRNAQSLFGQKILGQVDVEFRSIPLSGVSVGGSVISPFEPEVDLDKLIKSAAKNLDEDLHLIFLLAAGCGLRRSEIDRLRRQDVDLGALTIKIVNTDDGKVKRKNSIRTLNITKGGAVYQAIKSYRLGFHVVCPEAKRQSRKSESYRCNDRFEELAAWLRGQGVVKANQPIHYLRKAFGDSVASKYGIDIAAISLGDTIQMAHAVYNSHNKTKAIL